MQCDDALTSLAICRSDPVNLNDFDWSANGGQFQAQAGSCRLYHCIRLRFGLAVRHFPLHARKKPARQFCLINNGLLQKRFKICDDHLHIGPCKQKPASRETFPALFLRLDYVWIRPGALVLICVS